ncbi:hypothetical protein BFP76_06500 [Amylibacter kogurei]|uniref:Uncharacterized protein n=1 Tax=Paramylibacter kogurei TaxID=1889778 RepID=A0A2G5K5X5_9RHOB|nr:hypothetical protein [Amylibacter kogurei]PIB24815.1 hypothetical protein BFP76_06500 [Amylibacter kogurei]
MTTSNIWSKFHRPVKSKTAQKSAPNKRAPLTPKQEADLMHEVIGLSPFFEKFAVNSVALVEKRVAELKRRVRFLDDKTRETLKDRYGEGHEWRGLADENLLAIYACMMRLEMRLEWD